MKHKIALLALLPVYSLYFILGQILLIRFGLSLATGKLNGPLSIFTGNFLFDEWGNIIYFAAAITMLLLLFFSIDMNFSSKLSLSLMILPFILSSVGTAIAYKLGAVVSGQSGVMSVFGGMFVVYFVFEYVKWVGNIPKDLLVKLFTGMISLFVILMVVSLFSPIEIVLIDHSVSFALGIVFAVFIYKSNFHFSKLTRNECYHGERSEDHETDKEKGH